MEKNLINEKSVKLNSNIITQLINIINSHIKVSTLFHKNLSWKTLFKFLNCAGVEEINNNIAFKLIHDSVNSLFYDHLNFEYLNEKGSVNIFSILKKIIPKNTCFIEEFNTNQDIINFQHETTKKKRIHFKFLFNLILFSIC